VENYFSSAAGAAVFKQRNDTFEADARKRREALQSEMAAERGRLLEQAKAEAAEQTRQTAADAEAERARMVADLERKALMLSGQMAEKLLRRLPAQPASDAMMEALLDRIRALPDGEKAALVADAPLTVVTSAALGEDGQARCLGLLRAALPELAEPGFAVDPAVIVGAELRGRHILLRNSWHADLDDLLAAAKEDDHVRLG
jgi:F-type H+-transporting ATPase subunit b